MPNEEQYLFALEKIAKINGHNKTGQIADWARGIGTDPQLDRQFNAHMTDKPKTRELAAADSHRPR